MNRLDGSILEDLERAFSARSTLIKQKFPLRLFHGPGEILSAASRKRGLSEMALDLYGPCLWITSWEADDRPVVLNEDLLGGIAKLTAPLGVRFGVGVLRPKKGAPPETSRVLFGEGLSQDSSAESPSFEVQEEGMRFQIRPTGSRHPGLFLDHRELRQYLKLSGIARGRWLNTFSYTGSLSVALALGGATDVLTNDLSQATLKWAQENFRLNQMSAAQSVVRAESTLDLLEREGRRGARFDGVILDPPSFSRSKSGVFSTEKDLERLHLGAIRALNPGGILVTSLNNASLTSRFYIESIQKAAAAAGRREVQVVRTLSQPSDFPSLLGARVVEFEEGRYLKGWVLRVF